MGTEDNSKYADLKSNIDTTLNKLEDIVTTLEYNFKELYRECDNIYLLRNDGAMLTDKDKGECLERVNSLEKRIEALIQ